MKIRIKFRKTGNMRFIGHLDIMRYFQKAIRRADIDVKYTEGFSPHQVMSFAAPLGVGLTSDGEYLDIEVNSTFSSSEAVKRLNDVMVDGMEILSYVELKEGTGNAMAEVSAADYYMFFKNREDCPWTRDMLDDEIIPGYYNRPTIEVLKKTKKSEVIKDIKPLIYDFNAYDDDEKIGFFLQVSTGSVDNIKPELVIEDLFKFYGLEYDGFKFQIHRVEVYGRTDKGLYPLCDAGVEIV